MSGTEIVAWWGAIIATLVLGWDILKWYRSGPRLRKMIVLNAHYDDAKVEKREMTEYGESVSYEDYCHVELVNVGSIPTTIMGISAMAKTKDKNGMKPIIMPDLFTEHFGKTLPQVLLPGEVWSCRLPMKRYKFLLQHGRPEVRIRVSHLSKPLVLRAQKSANQELELTE